MNANLIPYAYWFILCSKRKFYKANGIFMVESGGSMVCGNQEFFLAEYVIDRKSSNG